VTDKAERGEKRGEKGGDGWQHSRLLPSRNVAVCSPEKKGDGWRAGAPSGNASGKANA